MLKQALESFPTKTPLADKVDVPPVSSHLASLLQVRSSQYGVAPLPVGEKTHPDGVGLTLVHFKTSMLNFGMISSSSLIPKCHASSFGQDGLHASSILQQASCRRYCGNAILQAKTPGQEQASGTEEYGKILRNGVAYFAKEGAETPRSFASIIIPWMVAIGFSVLEKASGCHDYFVCNILRRPQSLGHIWISMVYA